MTKWRDLVLILLVFVLVGCASKGTKRPGATHTSRVPPPIFGRTSSSMPNFPRVAIPGTVVGKTPITEGMATEGMATEGMDIPKLRIIHFDYDKSKIKAKARVTLEKHAAYLNSNPLVSLRLEGHADERGSREYNLALGERRAEATKNLLITLGVQETQLDTLSYGEERPVALGHNKQSWWQNRRVEFIYSEL